MKETETEQPVRQEENQVTVESYMSSEKKKSLSMRWRSSHLSNHLGKSSR